MAHGVYISELFDAKDETRIRNAKNPVEALDNGRPVTLSGLVDGERDLWVAAVATSSSAASDLWIVTTPELVYDESKTYTLADFYNGINDSDTERVHMRVTKHIKDDIFGVTAEVLSEVPTSSKAYIAPSDADGKGWTVSATSSGAYAKFIGTTTNEGLTYYSFIVL